MLKIKELKIKKSIANKHRKTLKFLWFITWVIFLPIVIIQFLGELFDKLSSICANIRNNIVYTIFKIIYYKEITAGLVEKIEE